MGERPESIAEIGELGALMMLDVNGERGPDDDGDKNECCGLRKDSGEFDEPVSV